MTKKIIAFAILILLGLGAWFGYQYFEKKGIERSVLSVLPEDAVYILKTNNLTDAWKETSETNIWQHLIKTKDFEYLEAIDTLLNKTLDNNQTAEIIFENRPVAMTAYMISQKDYDFVYTIDLHQAKIVKKALKQLLKTLNGYKVKSLKYQKQSVYKLTDLEKPNTKIFVAALDNILMVSFNYSLLQKIIDQRHQTHWLQQPAFTKINHKLNGGLIQFFFNYKQLPAFADLYFENAQTNTSEIARQLLLSGFDINHDDERIIMDGWTLTDSIPSYFNALLDVKPGRWSFDQVMSDQAAIVTSVGFKNFNIFYQSLSDQYFGDDVQKKNAYREQIKKLENYFSINLQQNLFDWIGQEISLAKIQSYQPNRPQDLVLLIQTEDIEAAQKGLDFIS
ncbi:MAG TPA: DUF3352 domain-containing protein [Flavobacteriales bacterium]|nr:DUF3352 domain-containing protein [Flavobacteriales bacterium]